MIRRTLLRRGSAFLGLRLTASCAFVVLAHTQVFAMVLADDLVPDPRAQGMGGAFTALAEGGWAVWWNPGALGLTPEVSVGLFSSATLLPLPSFDVRLRSAAFAVSRDGFGVGAHFARADMGELPVRDQDDVVIGTFQPFDSAIHLACGVDLVRAFRHRASPVGVGLGASVKRLHFDWDLDDPGAGTAYDANLGLLLRSRTPLRSEGREFGAIAGSVGYVRRNVFDQGIRFRGGGSAPLGSFNRLGFAAHLALGRHPNLGTAVDLTFALDESGVFGDRARYERRNYGLEVGALGTVFWRYGTFDKSFYRIDCNTWGIGLDPDILFRRWLGQARLHFDYAAGSYQDPFAAENHEVDGLTGDRIRYSEQYSVSMAFGH